MPAAAAVAAEPTVVTAMWRGLDVFRPLAWMYAAYTAYTRGQELARGWLAWVVLGVLGAWTLALALYRNQTRHTTVVGVELGLACCAILSTRLVDTPEVIVGGARTLPGLWPAAAVVAWAVLRGWRGGVVAALIVGVADIVELALATRGGIAATTMPSLTASTINNIVILVLLGGCIGYCADLSRAGHAALSKALRAQAEVRERDRLARTVHDGVLQVLSYIHRRGNDLGGEAGELGAMAAEQERALRALVSNVSVTHRAGEPRSEAGASSAEDEVDLRSLLERYASGTVSIIPPAEPVLMGADLAGELTAAVGAALDNTARHAGAQAQAWVLIEDQGKDVCVTIRDNGVGVPEGRLEEAAVSGRIGLAKSIRGRMSDLGGSATFESSPGAGTCVELTVSRKGRRR
jgi:signal transduction histidine kinase